MSETVSHRVRAFADPLGDVRRARPLPIGYGLLIGALASLGLWVGAAVAIVRLWP